MCAVSGGENGDLIRMKYLSFLVLMLLLLTGGCKEESEPRLVMVTNATFPPYEFVAGRKIDGIDPEIVRIIAERLGCRLEIRDMSFDSVIAAVQSGKADIAASGITVTEERKKQVNFTVPYVISRQMIIVLKDSDIKSAADLKKKRIGVQHGTTGDLFVSKNIAEPERYSHGPLAVAALLAGKVDAVVIDSEPAEIFVRQRARLKLLPDALTSEEYAFAISKKNRELLDKFNEELNKMRQSGELESIIKHYRDLNSDSHSSSGDDNKTFYGHLKQSFRINFLTDNRYKYLLNGFVITLKVTIFAVFLGWIIGFSVAVIRSTASLTGGMKIADFFCRLYLTVIRGTPMVVQLLIIYFVIFGSVDIDKVLVAIVAFGINSGAYVAEIIRGGIAAVDKGQMEAARSLGLGYWQSMREIILPQAFKTSLPALGNEVIVLLKETSVCGYIALHDLTKGGDIIRSQTYDAFLPLIAVALIYLAVVMILEKLLACLEKRLKKNE